MALRIMQEILKPPHTVREIADKTGLDVATVSRIVNGKQMPSYGKGKSAERIAEAVGWPLDRAAELFEEV